METNINDAGNEHLKKLLHTQKIIAERKAKHIVFSKPILTQNGNPSIFPKTINVIQGKAGVHKSRLAETICSTLIKCISSTTELLGFENSTNEPITICYVDTERNHADQLPYALQQIQLKAGYDIEDNVPAFDFISLLEFPREIRFEVLENYLSYIREKFSTHIFIVLDVITDCVFNFNDTKDSMRLIDLMNIFINQYNVTFLCLIHENPGSGDKARGHLGTEIMNKASTVLQVGFEKDADQKALDLIKVAYLKCRSTRKHEPFYACYSESEKRLVLASMEEVIDAADAKKQKAHAMQIKKLLADLLNEPMSKTDLFSKLTRKLDCGARVLEDRLKELMEKKIPVFESGGSIYYLNKTKRNNRLFYSLIPQQQLPI